MNRVAVIPVAEAASELGLAPRSILAMIDSGQLDAEKVGGRWLIDRASVERSRVLPAPRGRPLSPHRAWALLFLLGGEEVDWLSPHERSRLRSYLRHRDLASLVPRLRARARLHRLRGHPSDLPRIENDPQIVRSGASAARGHGVDIHAPGVVECYVPGSRLAHLKAQYHLRPSPEPNVLVRAVDDFWPFPQEHVLAPAPVVAVDLMEADDERSRRAGRVLLEELMAGWLQSLDNDDSAGAHRTSSRRVAGAEQDGKR